MRRILITGMSGTGKSTLIGELAALGYKPVDTDDDWPHWVTIAPDPANTRSAAAEPNWLWHEDRVQRLLATEDAEVLFVSGCRTNQAQFYPQFEHVILLTAPPALIAERLATRTNNRYGKDANELASVMGFQQTVEPRLRASASLEVDTSAPVGQVLATVLAFLRLDREGTGIVDRPASRP
ncbi:MAG: AAA family ATPase [Chloroflexi bacterium]|nr:AAA family ATPase [Chloroflexota bacterium]MDA1004618.1 AAA family ATPase [Chloroflexota bacterium]